MHCATGASTYPRHILWIAGDLNLPDINWTDSSIAGNNYPLRIKKVFKIQGGGQEWL